MIAFRATQRVRARPRPDVTRHAACAACEWLVADTCRHPSRACGCPINAIRITPWLKLRRCPAAAW